jgi:hypothetical protein
LLRHKPRRARCRPDVCAARSGRHDHDPVSPKIMAPLVQEILDWTVLVVAALAPFMSLVHFLWQLIASRCGSTSVVNVSDDKDVELNDRSREGQAPRPGFQWLESKVDEQMTREYNEAEGEAAGAAPPAAPPAPPPPPSPQKRTGQSSAASSTAPPFRRQTSDPQLEKHRFVHHKFPGVRGRRRRSHEEPSSVTVPPARRQSVSLDCGSSRGSTTTEASTQPRALW